MGKLANEDKPQVVTPWLTPINNTGVFVVVVVVVVVVSTGSQVGIEGMTTGDEEDISDQGSL